MLALKDSPVGQRGNGVCYGCKAAISPEARGIYCYDCRVRQSERFAAQRAGR